MMMACGVSSVVIVRIVSCWETLYYSSWMLLDCYFGQFCVSLIKICKSLTDGFCSVHWVLGYVLVNRSRRAIFPVNTKMSLHILSPCLLSQRRELIRQFSFRAAGLGHAGTLYCFDLHQKSLGPYCLHMLCSGSYPSWWSPCSLRKLPCLTAAGSMMGPSTNPVFW